MVHHSTERLSDQVDVLGVIRHSRMSRVPSKQDLELRDQPRLTEEVIRELFLARC